MDQGVDERPARPADFCGAGHIGWVWGWTDDFPSQENMSRQSCTGWWWRIKVSSVTGYRCWKDWQDSNLINASSMSRNPESHSVHWYFHFPRCPSFSIIFLYNHQSPAVCWRCTQVQSRIIWMSSCEEFHMSQSWMWWQFLNLNCQDVNEDLLFCLSFQKGCLWWMVLVRAMIVQIPDALVQLGSCLLESTFVAAFQVLEANMLSYTPYTVLHFMWPDEKSFALPILWEGGHCGHSTKQVFKYLTSIRWHSTMIVLWGIQNTCYYSTFQCSIQHTRGTRYFEGHNHPRIPKSTSWGLAHHPSKSPLATAKFEWDGLMPKTTGRVTVSSTSWNDLHGFFGVTRVGLGSFSGNDVGRTANDKLFTVLGWIVHPGWDRNGLKPKAGLPQSKKIEKKDSLDWLWMTVVKNLDQVISGTKFSGCGVFHLSSMAWGLKQLQMLALDWLDYILGCLNLPK